MAESQQNSNDSTSEVPASSNGLLTVAVVVGLVSGGWLILASALGHMGRPWPCAVLGTAILVGVTMAYQRPAQRVPWGLLILVAAIFAMLIGQGAVLPGLIGLVGGGLVVMEGSELFSGRSGRMRR